MILDQFSISLEVELINGIEYQTSTLVFNTLQKEKSEYYELIDNANYSAPDCGVMRVYQPIGESVLIYLIDGVSCGNMRLEFQHADYKTEFDERIKKLLRTAEHAFNLKAD